MKILIDNKKAYYDFEVLDKYQAGIVLEGWEVKSLKFGRGSIGGSFIRIRSKESILSGASISSWKNGILKSNEEEKRDRKLLLKSNEIKRIEAMTKEKGLTVVPLEVYMDDRGLIKVNLGVVRGKKKYDKRSKLKERDIKRGIEQDRKKYNI